MMQPGFGKIGTGVVLWLIGDRVVRGAAGQFLKLGGAAVGAFGAAEAVGLNVRGAFETLGLRRAA